MDAAARKAHIERMISVSERDKIRFAFVSQSGKHSLVWAAWGSGSDFYLGARGTLGTNKISLHASGICRDALTKTHHDKLAIHTGDPAADRAIIKWNRLPTPEVGGVPVVSLVFPTDYMTQGPPEASLRKPVWVFPAAEPGKAVEVLFVYSKGPPEYIEEQLKPVGSALFHSTLTNGDCVTALVRVTEFDFSVIPTTD